MAKSGGYNEPAKVVTPARIDKAFFDATVQRKQVAILEQYDEWWDFKQSQFSNRAELPLSVLPLGIFNWLSTLHPEITGSNILYMSPFAITTEWVQTHTSHGRLYPQPHRRSDETYTGVLQISHRPMGQNSVKVQFIDNNDHYMLSDYAAHKVTHGWKVTHELAAVLVYCPTNEAGGDTYWISAEELNDDSNRAMVPLLGREAGYRFLDLINNYINPMIHEETIRNNDVSGSAGRIKHKRSAVLQAYRSLFEVCEARGVLREMLLKISSFQKDAVGVVCVLCNDYALSATQRCENVEAYLLEIASGIAAIEKSVRS